MKVLNNYVLIIPEPDYQHHNNIRIVDPFDPEKHKSVFGRVISVPDRLLFYGGTAHKLKVNGVYNKGHRVLQKMVRMSLDYNTKMQVKVDDVVIYKYVAQKEALDDGWEFDIPGHDQKAILIRYDRLYASVRDSEMIMLNGWIFAEPVEMTKEDLTAKGGMKVYKKDKRKNHEAVIRCIGDPVISYLHHRDIQDYEGLEIGDHIIFKGKSVRFEYKLHNELNKDGYALIRLQRKDILATVS